MMFFKLPNKIIITANITIGWRVDERKRVDWLRDMCGSDMKGVCCVCVCLIVSSYCNTIHNYFLLFLNLCFNPVLPKMQSALFFDFLLKRTGKNSADSTLSILEIIAKRRVSKTIFYRCCLCFFFVSF